MRRFFIDGDLAEQVTITGSDAHHLAKVLRLKAGNEVIVTDKNGQTGLARIIAVLPEAVEVAVEDIIKVQNEPPVEVWLAQGLTKSDKLDFIVQKAVEIGAVGIIPMIADFSVVRYDSLKAAAKVVRWQKIAREAAKQCGRSLVPLVDDVKSLKDILSGVDEKTAVIMLYEGKSGKPLKDILSSCQAKKYLLLIGPEGGFSVGEADFCAKNGVQIATMGPRILRTETAATSALSVVMYEKGDLGGFL